MKFCTECGKKLPDTAKFCDECGTKVDAGTAMPEKRKLIEKSDVAKLLDDDKVEKVKDLIDDFKEENDCERIHVVGEDDFDKFVSNFVGVIKSRGGDENLADALPSLAIALIDNSKTGQGKRGALISKLGLFVIDKEIPNYEDGEDDDGCVAWALFEKFGMPVDDENYSILDVGMFKESDEVADEVKKGVEYSDDVTFFLRFSRTGLAEDQVNELMAELKAVVGEETAANGGDEDVDEDDIDEAEEADDDDDIDEAYEADDEDEADEADEDDD